jgi:hypothetical protein
MLIPRIGVITASVLSLTACLNTSTIIRVAADGSGTIEQTILVNPKAIENAFAGMGFKAKGGSSSSSSMKTLSEADMREAAGKLGTGVTLVSVTPVKQPSGFEGVSTKFAFDDIARLQTEDFLMPGPASEMSASGARDRIGFTLTRTPQGTSVLTATFDETPGKSSKNSAKSGKGGPGLDDPEALALVKVLFKGFRIGVDLEVIGTIVRTDADYVNGKRVTLAEIDIGQLLLEGKKLESLDKVLSPDASIAKVRPYLKDIKGLKINKPVVTIEFR